jgi:glycosyltransferase involved in cell wall biosynthesis
MNGFAGAIRHVARKLIGDSTGPKAIAKRINAACDNKRVLITDLPRDRLIQLFMSADLFVFASNIEYSPLVLFECAAAGTPFLTVDVGNAWEIAEMTGAGIKCESSRDDRGYTRVEPGVLAGEMRRCMGDPERLRQLGERGRAAWHAHFTWTGIAARYEALFRQLLIERRS